MAEKKYVDSNGLLYVWQKIKTLFNGKVDKVEGKQLSTNDYTTEEKNKLAGLNNYELPTASASVLGGVKVGAGLAINEGVLSATGGGTADAVDWSNVQNKPTKVSEFTNDSGFQTAEQVSSAIDAATDGLATETYVNNKISSVYKYKGSVANQAALPQSPETGDVYNLEDTGMNIAWDGTKWDNLGITIDLSSYVQESELVAITNQEIDELFAEE